MSVKLMGGREGGGGEGERERERERERETHKTFSLGVHVLTAALKESCVHSKVAVQPHIVRTHTTYKNVLVILIKKGHMN